MQTEAQQRAYDDSYGRSDIRAWDFHDTTDPLVRYLRDRRLAIALDHVSRTVGELYGDWSALVVCGGVGGEGTFLANRGLGSVTVSDFSARALDICRERDPRLQRLQLNAEALDVPDSSYDLVLVQDGLHELRRPALGVTEMLRVARRVAVVIEPHHGVVARELGRRWETHGGVDNYVFRWSSPMFRDVVRSYLVRSPHQVHVLRFWDHNVTMRKVADAFGGAGAGLALVRGVYNSLDACLGWAGNMMAGLVIKGVA